MESLGYKASQKSILPSDDHVVAVQELQGPADWDSLCRFIGIVKYVLQHVSKAVENLVPLLEVVKGSDWHKRKPTCRAVDGENGDARWGPAKVAAWRQLKSDLSEFTIWVAPRRGARKRVETDASDEAVGGVPLQEDGDGDWRPIALTAGKLRAPSWSILCRRRMSWRSFMGCKRGATTCKVRFWKPSRTVTRSSG